MARISIPAAGTGIDRTSHRELGLLRGELIPAAFASAPDATVMVGGVTAQTADFNASLATHTPLVFGFVLVAAFLLLLVTFRSLVIAIKAIILNLLSVGASYGVLVLVFQNGCGQKLLGFHSNGTIVAWLPLFLFVVLFGLSMDYHVFILSRVREAYDKGMSTERAVAHAIGTTAGVVTSAATVMVAVFALFGTLSNVGLKEMGVGLAVAVSPGRNDRPRDAAAGEHEAARRLELVASPEAPLAPPGLARGRAGAGRGLNWKPPAKPDPGARQTAGTGI